MTGITNQGRKNLKIDMRFFETVPNSLYWTNVDRVKNA